MSQAAPKAPPQGSPFWQFSLGFYRAPGVADACILLQDEAGVDVNLLFFLLWNASLKREFASTDVHAVDSCVAGWRKAAVIPLREIRRALVIEQETLFTLSQSAALGREAASAHAAARANIAAYEKYSARDFPKPAVDAILAAFGTKRH